jgi:phage baseplate assembly protein V
VLDLLIQRGARTGDLQDPDTARLNQQVSNLIHRGLVVSVDLENALATVQVGEVQTAALPWLTTRAGGDITWWAPEAGEHVAILCPGGSLSQGVIIGSLYSGLKPAPAQSADQHVTKYSDGTTITYDRAAHALTVQAVGTVTINIQGNAAVTTQQNATLTAQSITLTAQQCVTIDGDLALNGKLTTDLRIAGSARLTGTVAQNVPPLQL